MKKHGAAFGYHLTKCHIINKENLFEKAKLIFHSDEVEIVDWITVLDSVIGSDKAKEKFVERFKKLQLIKPAAHASVSPQNIYKLFNSSVQHI